MKNLNVSQPPAGVVSVSNFESARALAFSLAESDPELLEPELIAWFDRSTGMASPVLEGCSWPYGWHDYGVSHGGRLEVDVGGNMHLFSPSPAPSIPTSTLAQDHSSISATPKERDDLPSRRRILRAPR